MKPSSSKQQRQIAFERMLHSQYCELRPSSIHGIGVFALRSIPKGVDPFESPLKDKEVRIPHDQVKKLPRPVRRLMETFCYYDDTDFWVPVAGLNVVRISIYLNHSKQPNVRMLPDGSFRSLKRIAKDSEITMDYDDSFGCTHYF